MRSAANTVIITTKQDGTISNDKFNNYCLFQNCNNIYELETLKKFKSILQSDFKSKKIIINLFDENYAIYKFPTQINGAIFVQYIFEKWRGNKLNSLDRNLHIDHALFDFTNYNTGEQEIIYCLLSGFEQDTYYY